MFNNIATANPIVHLVEFLHSERIEYTQPLPSISLFSGGGLSDLGYEQAGFKVYVQAEIEPRRVELCKRNFPESQVIEGDISETRDKIIETYQELEVGQLQLMNITPPCQGMSSSNPARGQIDNVSARDVRNRLMLEAIPIILTLQPRIVIIENVAQILREKIEVDGEEHEILEIFTDEITENYEVFSSTVQLADYGIPQMRNRAIVVAIHRDLPVLDTLISEKIYPWNAPTHSDKSEDLDSWVTAGEWFDNMPYPPLDSATKEGAHDGCDPLHFVTYYEKEPFRYTWIEDIPPRSGLSAYLNANCRECGFTEVPEGVAYCPECNEPLLNRPHVVKKDGTIRLIKGYSTAYRRIPVDRPTPTITTSSSHLGSNYKIHPWENRVLSIRECADLQTVPRFYDWDYVFENNIAYVARQVIGEALPTWFTYIHGLLLQNLLENQIDSELFARK